MPASNDTHPLSESLPSFLVEALNRERARGRERAGAQEDRWREREESFKHQRRRMSCITTLANDTREPVAAIPCAAAAWLVVGAEANGGGGGGGGGGVGHGGGGGSRTKHGRTSNSERESRAATKSVLASPGNVDVELMHVSCDAYISSDLCSRHTSAEFVYLVK